MLHNKIQQLLLVGASNSPQAASVLTPLLQEYASPDALYWPLNQQILAATSILAVLDKGAAPLQVGTPPQTIAPDEPRLPVCPQRLINALSYALRHDEEEIITEFVHHFDADKYRLPDYLLPDFLHYATQKKHLQMPILACLGSRAGWLQSQNPDWQFIPQEKGAKPNRYQAAQQEYAHAHIQFDPASQQWHIDLPDEINPDLRKIHLKANLHHIEGGEKASFLWQLLAATNPSHWLSPNIKYKDLLYHARQSEWFVAILGGLIAAAQNFGDADLLAQLHKFYLQNHQLKCWSATKTNFIAVSLAPAQHEEIGQLYLQDAQKNGSDAHPFITFMMQTDIWSPALALATLQLIAEASRETGFNLYYGLRALLQRAAFCAPTQIQSDLDALLQPLQSTLPANWERDFNRLQQTLARRAYISQFYK